MEKIKPNFMLVLFIVSASFIILPTNFAEAEEYGGVEFPDGAVSFADVVINYNPGSGVIVHFI